MLLLNTWMTDGKDGQLKLSRCLSKLYLLLTFWLIQFRPSKRPSPVVAHDGCTYQGRSLIVCNCKRSVTSAGVIAINHNRRQHISESALRCNRACHSQTESKIRSKEKKNGIPPGRSCLLAKTSKRQSFISRSEMMRCNSCRASSILSLSCESITKINPWVPV